MFKKILKIAVFALVFAWMIPPPHASAQKNLYLQQPDLDFLRAKELYEKEKYGAAMDLFGEYLNRDGEASSLWREEARYLQALCAVELYQDDAAYLLYSFVKQYPGSPLHNDALFACGKLAYRDRQYGNCLRWFAQVETMYLTGEELAEYYFMKGYSHFQRKQYPEARVAFYEILGSEDRYASPATYYYSHVNYEQKNYETALKGFLSLEDDETFSPIIPYYVTQIYYMQEKWEEVIAYAPGLLESVTRKRYAEMARILGEAYFHLNRYPEAVKYLEQYHERTNYTLPEAKYMMGFAYYMTGKYKKALPYFKAVSLGKDEIAQSALYHMADCYVKLGDKYQARLSFSAASKMDFNPRIKEDALFNYAVVTYELSMSPFNEAIQGFLRYLSLYPASERADEAYQYLILAFMSTRNYRAALASLERIRHRTPDIERSYQRVAFFRGLELFYNLSFQEAVEKFDVSLEYGQYDRILKALCHYWKGESNFRLDHFDQAIADYQEFLGIEGTVDLEEYLVCYYNLGYAEFKKGNYREALGWFRQFESRQKGKNRRMLADACNRIGDMYFIDARYAQAVENYDKAIEIGAADVDYALFQKGISLGVLKQYREKIGILDRILKEFPNSNYLPDALYETGRSFFILQEPERAIPYYQKILDELPNSAFVSRALVQLGLVYFNLNRPEQSLEYYKRVVSDYPGTQDANDALLGIKNVYFENNRVNDYFAYVESLGGELDISAQEQDSLSYLSAENIYLGGDCRGAIKAFDQYISEYPSGAYLSNAHFYRAECQLKEQDPVEALVSLQYIIEQPRNPFSEPALLTASRINYDFGNTRAALENFQALEKIAGQKNNLNEARIGRMRCHYLLEEYADAIDAARAVLRIENIPAELAREARFKIAKSFYAQDRFALALEEFRKVAVEVSSEEGAESKYRVAEILYIRKAYQEAEDVIFEFIDLNTPHQYWMGKSFILLADLYLIKEDEFQAVQTLQSIIDYYEDTQDGILDLAVRKKAEILKRQQKGTEEPEEELEIETPEKTNSNG